MKVIVCDSVGSYGTMPGYTNYLPPNIKVRGIDQTTEEKTHPHGHQVAYYATHLLHLRPESEHELVFVRIFDGDAGPLNNNEWLLDVLAEEITPDTVINMSWGMDDGESAVVEAYAKRAWSKWASKFVDVVGNTPVFSASGNSDHNDSDEDLNYPWKLIPHIAICVGSHDRGGIPSVFSSDGAGVFLTMWGENIPLLNGNGRWTIGSGTSFSSPKAAGLCAYLGGDASDFRKYVRSHATKPDEYSGYLPHVKWGWGSLEYRYQELSSQINDSCRPPIINKPEFGLAEYHDFKEIS